MIHDELKKVDYENNINEIDSLFVILFQLLTLMLCLKIPVILKILSFHR